MPRSLCRPASLHGFAMERQIEALLLDFLGHAQPDEDIDDLEDDQRYDAVVNEHRADADRLVHDLHWIALKQTRVAAVLTNGKHAGEQRARGSANRMHSERIKRVIVAEQVLEAGAAPVADEAGRNADPERAQRTDESRGRGDGGQPGHRARADADHGRLAL